MTLTYLAALEGAFQAGYLVSLLGVPAVGWILLIVGLKQCSRSRSQSHLKRPTQSSSPTRGAASGNTLIVIGAVLLVLGVLAIVGRLASAGS